MTHSHDAVAQNYLFSFSAWGDPQWGAGNEPTGGERYLSDSLESVQIVDSLNIARNGRYASFHLILGDITDHRDSTVYEHTKQVLDRLDSTYYVIPGNHDCDPGIWPEMAKVFDYPPSGTTGSIEGGYYFIKENWCFIHLNTAIDGEPAHDVPADTLSKYLNIEPGKYKVIFHHHPFFIWHDEINDAECQDSLIAHNDEVRLDLAGHRHDFLGDLDSGIYFMMTNSGNVYPGYEVYFFDVFDDGQYQIDVIKNTEQE